MSQALSAQAEPVTVNEKGVVKFNPVTVIKNDSVSTKIKSPPLTQKISSGCNTCRRRRNG